MKKRNLIKVPDKVQIFVFGSVLHKCEPNDIDIIIIYDSFLYPDYTIINACKKVLLMIQKNVKLKPHVTYLSEIEEQHCKFIVEVGAIPIESYLSALEGSK